MITTMLRSFRPTQTYLHNRPVFSLLSLVSISSILVSISCLSPYAYLFVCCFLNLILICLSGGKQVFDLVHNPRAPSCSRLPAMSSCKTLSARKPAGHPLQIQTAARDILNGGIRADVCPVAEQVQYLPCPRSADPIFQTIGDGIACFGNDCVIMLIGNRRVGENGSAGVLFFKIYQFFKHKRQFHTSYYLCRKKPYKNRKK